MSVYLIIWAVLTTFLVLFWVWSTTILYQQKKSWKAYAQNKKLRYRANRFFDSPEISGVFEGYKIVGFTSEHDQQDGRLIKRLTCLEVSLKGSLPVSTAIASGGMVDVVEELSFQYEYRPDIRGWDNSYIARSRDEDVMRAYLTTERLQQLVKLMKVKNSWIILIFVGGQGLLRIDTPDPLDNIKTLEKYVRGLVNAAKVLDLDRGEAEKLMSSTQKKAEGLMDLDNVDVFEQPINLTLEDD